MGNIDPEVPPQPTRRCIYCGSELAPMAVLCPTCKSYQDKWRNRLVFAAGLTGVATIAAGALAFVAQQGVQGYRTVFWRDTLNVLEFEGWPRRAAEVVVSNSGYGPVLMSELIVYSHGDSLNYEFDRTVKADEVERINTPYWKSRDKNIPDAAYVGTPTGRLTPKQAEQRSEIGDVNRCIYAAYFSPDHSSFKRFQTFYKGRLVVEEATGTLFYFGTRPGPKKQTSFSIVTAFLLKDTPECKSLSP